MRQIRACRPPSLDARRQAERAARLSGRAIDAPCGSAWIGPADGARDRAPRFRFQTRHGDRVEGADPGHETLGAWAVALSTPNKVLATMESTWLSRSSCPPRGASGPH